MSGRGAWLRRNLRKYPLKVTERANVRMCRMCPSSFPLICMCAWLCGTTDKMKENRQSPRFLDLMTIFLWHYAPRPSVSSQMHCVALDRRISVEKSESAHSLFSWRTMRKVNRLCWVVHLKRDTAQKIIKLLKHTAVWKGTYARVHTALFDLARRLSGI